jgi:O-antigen/teichoic acid export membrane protein
MISGSFVEISITIVLAFFFLRNVWALVFGLLGGNFVRMALSYCVHPYRPRISFNFHHFVKIFSFGKWIFTSTVLFFLLKNGDNTFVGKMLGIASLGFYQIAYRLANMPTEQITNVLSPIIFPAYSKLQDNLPRLRQAYLNSLQLIAFIAIPMAAGIFILAPEFTKIFLGEKWMPVVQPMRVLCIAGAIRAIAATSGPIFLALGRPDINTRLAFAQLISIAILIYPLTSMWGIIGTALSISITGCLFIFAILISLIRLTKMRNSDISHLIKNILFPLIAIAPVMGIKTIFITPFMNNANLILITVIAIGIITYLINTYLLDKCMNYNILIKIKACSELLNFKKVF